MSKAIFRSYSRLLLRDVVLYNAPEEQFDVLIVDGIIKTIGRAVKAGSDAVVVEMEGAYIAPGLVDMHVHLREPGREDEETVESGANAAMAGGFTTICAMPNTEPAADSQEILRFVKRLGEDHLVEVLPVAALTKGRKGKELTEMGDLIEAGAIALSDDGDPVRDAGVMRRALEYSRMFNVAVINHSEEPSLSGSGVMHEGLVSTRLGMPGIPAEAEEVMVARDLKLAALTGGRLHVPHVSGGGTVALIREAKKRGLSVTCEVTPHHLALNDEAVASFDPNTKMNPPLRSEADRLALLEGLRDGTIDAIASDHAPHALDEKERDFLDAPFGVVGLETAFGVVLRSVVQEGVLPVEGVIEKMSVAPRRILGLPAAAIEEGAEADLMLFVPDKPRVVKSAGFLSRSRNTPFEEWTLPGSVIGVVRGSRAYLPEVDGAVKAG